MSAEIQNAPARVRNSHIFERQAEDWYVEPAWCWARLFERLDLGAGHRLHDPACGKGTSVETALAAGYLASGSDIVGRWSGSQAETGRFSVADYSEALRITGADIIVSNPPFKIAREFAEAAMRSASIVCLLLPAKWACGDARARWLSETPLAEVLFLTPRPSILPGAGVPEGTKLGGGTTDYAIFFWNRAHSGAATVGWLHRDTGGKL